MEKLFTMAEAAAALNVPVNTLRFWRHAGTGPASFRLGPKRVMYAESALGSWVAEQAAADRSRSARDTRAET